jgi:hypothetical protein
MSTLRLGIHKLPAAEVAVIRTIVRLYATDVAFPWKLVDAPPYDALLVDGSATEGERTELGRMAKAMLALTYMNAGDLPDTMERPIRADKLQQWLKSTARSSLAARTAAPRVNRPESEASDSVRFMLCRWPSALLLGNDPDNVRMASLLSRRALNTNELANISRLSLSRCATFLLALRSAGMLELHVTRIVPAPRELPQASAFAGVGRSDFASSLINSLRRRLGLRTS